ncbi:hypothetical protein IB262_35250 [Ensifer sp. ENS02]|uniref:hypothetical protein n=1 Tax=Ensifer sp. ENS02 TaxID=2769290 RepID=UPI00177C2285|nr:hypothetical protein [Ensifer sp. ENS02]MBD9525109.1 hypothetical protein [Ensifer sp. ENS02]
MVAASSGKEHIDAPSADDVREQLASILSSDKFHLPERARSFLRFVVNETLEGRAEYLKAFTIAHDVFGRRDTFDAQNDPVVRIEAGRIRRELERYYLLSGPSERVVITIPKGGYVPAFEFNDAFKGLEQTGTETLSQIEYKLECQAATPERPKAKFRIGFPLQGALAAAVVAVVVASALLIKAVGTDNGFASMVTVTARPVIAVERFRDVVVSDRSSSLSMGLTEEIIGNLVKFKEIVVTAGTASAGRNPTASGYILQGSVRLENEKVRSIARLVRRSDGVIIWANNYDSDLRAQSSFEIQSALAKDIATAVAQPFGVIFQTDTKDIASQSVGGWDAYTCTLAYYSYRTEMTQPAHEVAKDCLEKAIIRAPSDATMQAFLALLFLDEVRFSYKLGLKPASASLEKSFKLAEHAVELDPQNARALQALMLASVFRNDIQSALRAGAAAYAINPNDTEAAGEYGLRLAMSGKWETGCGFISNAVSKGAGPKGYFEVGMALCAFIDGDLAAAELWSRMSDLDYNPMHHMVLTAILGAAGRIDEARTELKWINEHAPALMANIKGEISLRIARQEDRERIFAGLRAAGVETEESPGATKTP